MKNENGDKIVNLRINVSQFKRTVAKGAAGLVIAGSLFGTAWFGGKKVVEGISNAQSYQVEQHDDYNDNLDEIKDKLFREIYGGNPNNTNYSEDYDLVEIDGYYSVVSKGNADTTVKRSR